MKAFRLSIDQAILFYEICDELKADTEEKRVAVLQAMAQYGQVEGITETQKTKEEYIKHLSEHFGNVLVVKPPQEKSNV
jgi:hypothetical protein